MVRSPALPSLAIIGALIALATAWIWPIPGMARDLFAAHMFQHLLVINVAAMLIAAARDWLPAVRHVTTLPIVTALQLAALWMWHAPAVLEMVHHSPVWQGLMQVSLFAAAWLFWRAVLGCWNRPVWHPIFALLITGKIFCVLGATFVFSRRPLYPHFGSPESWGFSALEDQQLAGLLMVSSCALIYVAAAVALFARWLETFPTEPQSTQARDGALIAG
jgi:putative membrane protein